MKKSDYTKNTIISSAGVLFMDRGYTAVTMQDICDVTGLSRGGLYRYFSSVEHIFLAVLQQEQKDDIEHINTRIINGASATAILHEFLSTQITEITKRRSLNQATVEFFMMARHRRTFARAQFERAGQALKQLIDYGIAAGEFQDVNQQLAAKQLVIMIEGLRVVHIVAALPKRSIETQLRYIEKLIIKE